MGKLAKGFLRTNNQDTNSRLCMAAAVTAYRTSAATSSMRSTRAATPSVAARTAAA